MEELVEALKEKQKSNGYTDKKMAAEIGLSRL